jgi:DDE superfamily endonuclease
MRPGWYYDANGERVDHILRNEKDEQLGLLSILKHRGNKHLSIGGHELRKICYDCEHGTPKEQLIKEGTYDEKCCLTHVLSNEPDFIAQKEWLTEVVENSNCKIIFFPKYHCELNFIEMVWGWLKSYHRRSTTYNFNHLVENLPLSLETKLPLAFVRRAAQHCFRFMQGYRHGLSGTILEYAVKKYTSHRAIPANVFRTIEADFEEAKKIKAEKSKK